MDLRMRTTGKARKAALFLMALSSSHSALADWHYGRVEQLGFGYDGISVVFRLTGWSRNNCTCYSAWPNQMCLDRNRDTYKEEYAWLLRARATGQEVGVNIDETTCKVLALFELD